MINKSTILNMGKPFPVEGLVSYIKFEDNIIDEYGYEWTKVGNGTFTNGKIGKSFSNVDNGGLTTTTFQHITQAGKYSIACWFKWDGNVLSKTYNHIFQNTINSSNRNYISLLYNSTSNGEDFGNISCGHWNGSTLRGGKKTSNNAIKSNIWYYLVYTYDNGTSKLYINNVEETLTETVAHTSLTVLTTIGNRSSFQDNSWFNGQIDEFAIWNRAITADEITTLYNAGRGKPYFRYVWDGLTSYWGFDEVSGTTASDSKGSNNGTANNARVLGSAGFHNNGADFTKGIDEIVLNQNIVLGNSYSIGGWINVKDFSTANNQDYVMIFYKGNFVQNNSWGFELRNMVSTNQVHFIFRVWNTSSSHFNLMYISNYSQFQFNTWHYITYTQNGTSNAKLYWNGVDLNATLGNTLLIPSSTTGVVRFGKSGGSVSTEKSFVGLTDEFAIWNRALSQADVNELYNNGNGKFY